MRPVGTMNVGILFGIKQIVERTEKNLQNSQFSCRYQRRN